MYSIYTQIRCIIRVQKINWHFTQSFPNFWRISCYKQHYEINIYIAKARYLKLSLVTGIFSSSLHRSRRNNVKRCYTSLNGIREYIISVICKFIEGFKSNKNDSFFRVQKTWPQDHEDILDFSQNLYTYAW